LIDVVVLDAVPTTTLSLEIFEQLRLVDRLVDSLVLPVAEGPITGYTYTGVIIGGRGLSVISKDIKLLEKYQVLIRDVIPKSGTTEYLIACKGNFIRALGDDREVRCRFQHVLYRADPGTPFTSFDIRHNFRDLPLKRAIKDEFRRIRDLSGS
jgi:hypothetical protein